MIASTSDPEHGIPHGPIASAYYSIARNSGRSAEIFGLALEHLNTALALGSKNTTNLFAIRGSIYLRLNQLDPAIADYEQVARDRKPLGGSIYGEALSELGHALVIAGRSREGLTLLEQGVDLMKNGQRTGFEIRANRKLAMGYAKTLSFQRALTYALVSYDKALQAGAHDQISRLERLAERLDWLRHR